MGAMVPGYFSMTAHMDIDRKRRRQSSSKPERIPRPLHSSRGTLSAKDCVEVEGRMQVSCAVMLRDCQQHRGRQHKLCSSDFDGQDAIAKRTRHAERSSQLVSGTATHDCPNDGDVHLECQRHQLAETEGHHAAVPAKRARRSSSMKHRAVRDQSQQNSVDAAICTDLCLPSESVIKSNVSAGTMNRLPGRMGKRSRAGTRQQLVSYHFATVSLVQTVAVYS